jgi:type IV pilus assembly protein PilW
MHVLTRIGRLLAREQGGFTLSELLVATMIGMVVIGGGVTVFTAAIRSQPKQTARDNAIRNARTTMERMTRELRQASTIVSGSANSVTVITWVHKASCAGASASTSIQSQVNYTCTAGICSRTERNTNGTGNGSTSTVVRGLSSSNIFTYTSACSSSTVAGEDAITVSDGVVLRNTGTSSVTPPYICTTLVFPTTT